MKIIKSSNFRSVPSGPEYPLVFSAPPAPDSSVPKFREILLAHKGIFAGCVLLCLAVAALATYSTSPVYQAKGLLELQAPPASTYSTHDGEAAGAINAQTFDSWIETQIGILESTTLVRRVVARLKLEEQLNAYRPQGLAAPRKKYFSPQRDSITREQAFEIATNNLKVRQSRLNNLIEIFYNAKDPGLAAAFVNALAEEYELQNLESRWQMAQSTGNWLTSHLTDLRIRLENSETALQDYSRANGLLFVADDKQSVAKERLHQLQEALSRAQSGRMERQSQMEMAAEVTPDSVPQVLDSAE